MPRSWCTGGLRVPSADPPVFTARAGLGTHALHRLMSGRSRQDLLALAYDLGVRYFDTAPAYGQGVAERELGQFARGHRDGIVLATKFGIAPGRMAGVPGWTYASMAARALKRALGRPRKAGLPNRDFSPAAARTSLEHSLRTLGLERVDILHLHEPDLELIRDGEELCLTLQQLKAAGKLRYVGLAGGAAAVARVAQAHPQLAQVLQVEAAPAGLPAAGAGDLRPDVLFWESTTTDPQRPLPPQVARAMQQVRAAGPTVMLFSTPGAGELRDAVRIMNCELPHRLTAAE